MRGNRCRILVLAFFFASCLAGHVDAADTRLQFNLPPSTVADALRRISEHSQVPLLYAQELVETLEFGGFVGETSVEEIVAQVVAAHGLTVQKTEHGVLLITRADPPKEHEVEKVTSKLKRGLLGSVAGIFSALLSVTAPVSAQDRDSQTKTLEEIVVTGIRSSLQNSLDVKRNAKSTVDAVSSEDIGKLPDENIAEALQRISGISIERDAGEGTAVSIRGLPTDFTAVTINGKSAPSTTAQRTFSFDVLASELVRTLEVYKTPEAKLDDGGLGGTVNLVTPRPLNIGERVMVGSVTGIYSELADEFNPKVSGFVSDTFSDDRLGILFGVTYTERSQRLDSVGLQWRAADRNADGTSDLFYPINLRHDIYLEDRTRFTANGALEFRPDDNLNFYVEGTHSRFDTDQFQPTFVVQRLRPAFVIEDVGSDGTLLAATDTPRLPVAMPGDNAQSPRVQTPTRFADSEETFDFINGGVDYERDSWKVSPSFSVSGGELDYSRVLRFIPRLNNINIDYRLLPDSDQLFEVALSRPNPAGGTAIPIDVNDLGALPLAFGDLAIGVAVPEIAKDRDYGGQIDIVKEFDDFGPLNSFDFGFKYRDRTKKVIAKAGSLSISGDVSCCIQNFPGEFFGGNAQFSSWAIVDPDALRDQFNLPSDSEILDGASVDRDASFSVLEQTISGYAQINLDGEMFGLPYRGNAGVRVVETNQESQTQARDIAGMAPVERSYTNVLPAFNLSIDVMEDLILRLGVAKALTRPALNDLSPREFVDASAATPTITSGNPFLDPFQAWQYDVGIERYFGDVGLVNIAFFHKRIQSFVFDDSRLEFRTVDLGPNGIISDEFVINAPFNGESGKVTGFEAGIQQSLSFLPAPFDGFGYVFNYTYADSSVTFPSALGLDDNLGLPGLSKNSFNAIVYFENYRFSARLAYNWREKFVRSVNEAGFTRFTDSSGQLDGSVSVSVTENIDLTFQAVNITDTKRRDFSDIQSRPRNVDVFGRRVFLGLNFSF